MGLPEKRDTSLLFSLHELRTIEADRVRDEEAAKAARAAAEVAAREAELRRVIEEQERRAREIQAAEAAQLAEAERQARETAMRLEEAERRARVEGQMRLEESRIKMEIEANAAMGARKKPVALIAIAVVLFLAVAGLGVVAYQKSQANEVAEKNRQAVLDQLAKDSAAFQKQIDDLNAANAKLDDEISARVKAMSEAKSAAEAQAAAAEIKALQDKKNENGRKVTAIAGEKRRHEEKSTGPAPIKIKICDQNDPMCRQK